MKYGKSRKMYNKGKKVMSGNEAAMGGNNPKFKTRKNYVHGGGVKMDGCQPVYDGTPQAKAN